MKTLFTFLYTYSWKLDQLFFIQMYLSDHDGPLSYVSDVVIPLQPKLCFPGWKKYVCWALIGLAEYTPVN